MKKAITVALLLLMVGVSLGAARRPAQRPLIELGPKASLYIGSVRFGFGAELVINPLKNAGLRFDITELSFGDGNTQFYFNTRSISIDGMIYLPMSGINPYAFLGFGLAANGGTDVLFRGGLGFNYPMTRGTDLFLEPGIIIDYNSDADDTDVTFRLSLGGRFGLIK